jgi:hypothetical protein
MARAIGHAQGIPADCRVRVPVRLRGHRAGRARRERRMAVPAAGRQPQRVRRDPGPGRGWLPDRPGRRGRARRPPLPARVTDAGDHLEDQDRLADRPRRAVRVPLVPPPAPLASVAPRPWRSRARAPPAAHGAVRERQRRAGHGLRAGVRLRPHSHAVGLRRRRLQRGGRRCRWRPGVAADDQPAPRP